MESQVASAAAIASDAKSGGTDGSTRLLTDGNGNTVSGSGYEYDAFGNALSSFNPDTAATPLLYSGEYWDKEKDSYFLRGRPSYIPMLGRFDTRDPTIFGAGRMRTCMSSSGEIQATLQIHWGISASPTS